MDLFSLVLTIVASVTAIIFGYFQVVVPFVKGEVRFTRRFPFVESSRRAGEEGEGAQEGVPLLFADMVGYIALTMRDQALAEELRAEFDRTVRATCSRKGGRIARARGDEFLVEFGTALDAALCAIELQKVLHERNRAAPEGRGIRARSGLHVGVVARRGDEVFGEGVDVVTRVERLAGPGGICLTEDVAAQIRRKIEMPLVGVSRGARRGMQLSAELYRLVLPWQEEELSLSERLYFGLERATRRGSVRAGLVVALLAIFGVRYFWLAREAQSGEPVPTAVVDFVNETGERELDGLSGMLITSLEQSRRLSVATRSRLFDILKRMGREGVERIDEQLGKEICREAGLDALVIASIRKFGSLYTVDLKVLDPRSDRYLFTARVEGQGQENIPAMIDELSERTRAGLKERMEEIRRASRRIAEVTTPNLEAYQHYFQGEALISETKFPEAEGEFREAIRLDSTFALAYYRLAYTTWWNWESEQVQRDLIGKAMALIDRVPEKERYLIRALDAYAREGFQSGLPILREMEKIYPDDKEMLYDIGDWSFHLMDLRTSEKYLQRVLAIDPRHERALDHLILLYGAKGQLERMREYAERYAALNEQEGTIHLAQYHRLVGDYRTAEELLGKVLARDPQHWFALLRMAMVNAEIGRFDRELEYARRGAAVSHSGLAYQELGVALARTGDPAGGLRVLLEALQLSPKNRSILPTIADLYRIEGNYQESAAALGGLIGSGQPDVARMAGYWGLVRHGAFLGRYRDALAACDSLVRYQGEVGDTVGAATTRLMKSLVAFWAWGDAESLRRALQERARYWGEERGIDLWMNLALAYAVVGDFPRADSLIAQRAAGIRWARPSARCLAFAAAGRCEEAEDLVDSLRYGHPVGNRVILLYRLAECHLGQGHPERALKPLRELQELAGAGYSWWIFYPKSVYLAGRASEEKGDRVRGMERYEKFLNLWREADPDLPELLDARARLARMRAGASG